MYLCYSPEKNYYYYYYYYHRCFYYNCSSMEFSLITLPPRYLQVLLFLKHRCLSRVLSSGRLLLASFEQSTTLLIRRLKANDPEPYLIKCQMKIQLTHKSPKTPYQSHFKIRFPACDGFQVWQASPKHVVEKKETG